MWYATRLLFAALFVITYATFSNADTLPPSHVDRVDMLELENIQLKLDALERQAHTLYERRLVILSHYKIDITNLNKTVTIKETGEIIRSQKEAPR